jgi:hypothetical protein
MNKYKINITIDVYDVDKQTIITTKQIEKTIEYLIPPNTKQNFELDVKNLIKYFDKEICDKCGNLVNTLYNGKCFICFKDKKIKR